MLKWGKERTLADGSGGGSVEERGGRLAGYTNWR